jgi:hypothetical protein
MLTILYYQTGALINYIGIDLKINLWSLKVFIFYKMSNKLKLGLGLVAAVCLGGFYAGYKKLGSSSNKLSI